MLPVEMSSKIVEYADYLSLRHMSHVNEVYKALVRRRLEREARQIRAQLEVMMSLVCFYVMLQIKNSLSKSTT